MPKIKKASRKKKENYVMVILKTIWTFIKCITIAVFWFIRKTMKIIWNSYSFLAKKLYDFRQKKKEKILLI